MLVDGEYNIQIFRDIGIKQFLEAQAQIEIVSEAGDGYSEIDRVKQSETDLAIMDVCVPPTEWHRSDSLLPVCKSEEL